MSAFTQMLRHVITGRMLFLMPAAEIHTRLQLFCICYDSWRGRASLPSVLAVQCQCPDKQAVSKW